MDLHLLQGLDILLLHLLVLQAILPAYIRLRLIDLLRMNRGMEVEGVTTGTMIEEMGLTPTERGAGGVMPMIGEGMEAGRGIRGIHRGKGIDLDLASHIKEDMDGITTRP